MDACGAGAGQAAAGHRERTVNATAGTDRPRLASEAGSSLLGTTIALFLFFGFLLTAVQVGLGLYTRTLATSAAFDAARAYSVSDRSQAAEQTARDLAVNQLGEWGQQATLTFDSDGEVVRVRVQGDAPLVLLRWFGDLTRTRTIDRTVEMRVEEFR